MSLVSYSYGVIVGPRQQCPSGALLVACGALCFTEHTTLTHSSGANLVVERSRSPPTTGTRLDESARVEIWFDGHVSPVYHQTRSVVVSRTSVVLCGVVPTFDCTSFWALAETETWFSSFISTFDTRNCGSGHVSVESIQNATQDLSLLRLDVTCCDF